MRQPVKLQQRCQNPNPASLVIRSQYLVTRQTMARNYLPPVTRATFPSSRKRESKPWIAAIVLSNVHETKKDVNSVCLRSFNTLRVSIFAVSHRTETGMAGVIVSARRVYRVPSRFTRYLGPLSASLDWVELRSGEVWLLHSHTLLGP